MVKKICFKYQEATWERASLLKYNINHGSTNTIQDVSNPSNVTSNACFLRKISSQEPTFMPSSPSTAQPRKTSYLTSSSSASEAGGIPEVGSEVAELLRNISLTISVNMARNDGRLFNASVVDIFASTMASTGRATIIAADDNEDTGHLVQAALEKQQK
ncbi:hypothetical protein K469DRAFT_692293 [Zopfia rhizophila CBS 207.26]|uniref:Uncharacterized protein n=1 Tax=Zopfia rhizophila CBS 207.26 TaxID=1314779 RepID=A0A6A6DNC2_9PEZI|nr:hypothetical protein K469DRAFT_692293 [Zopfia rhizophila CBS 207.26]